MSDIERQHNIEIAEDTLRIIKNNYYVKNQRRIDLDEDAALCGICYDKVKVFSPEALRAIARDDRLLKIASNPSKNCEFYLVDGDTFEVVNSFPHGLAMNFANAKYPGGGFLNGAKAQEESLCRCSTLYASLSSKEAKEMYDFNKKSKLPCHSDYMLLSPNVIVFRNNDGEYLDEPYFTSVMTVAAPDRKNEARGVPQKELNRVIKERLRYFLMAAAHEGYRDIVLGAWGCGAFRNDPVYVAQCFYDLFFQEGLCGLFDTVAFAILGGGINYQAFSQVFDGKIENCDDDKSSGISAQPFIEATKNAPVCNHSFQDLTNENLGYTVGVLADGTPFEADLWLEGNDRNISFYMPENEDLIVDESETESISESPTPVTQHECRWESILGIGMAEREIDIDNQELIDYVYYLTENRIVEFTSEHYNGRLNFLTDIEGNDLVCVSIALDIDGEPVARTGLHFRPFPNQPRNPISFIIKNTKQEK